MNDSKNRAARDYAAVAVEFGHGLAERGDVIRARRRLRRAQKGRRRHPYAGTYSNPFDSPREPSL
jgi:hypothetical protein